MLLAFDWSDKRIAAALGITEPTFRKHFRYEMLTARKSMFAKGVKQLDKAINKGEQWAIQHVLRTQFKELGWSERMQLANAEGGDLFQSLNLERLSDEQFEQLKKTLRAAGAAVPD